MVDGEVVERAALGGEVVERAALGGEEEQEREGRRK